jgi:hypothetical protein
MSDMSATIQLPVSGIIRILPPRTLLECEKSLPRHKNPQTPVTKIRCTAQNTIPQPRGQSHEDPSKSKVRNKIHDARYAVTLPSRTPPPSGSTSLRPILGHSHAPFPSPAAQVRSAQRTNGSVILHRNISASHSTAVHHVRKAQSKAKATSSTVRISSHNISAVCTPLSPSRRPLRRVIANSN